VNKFAGFWFRMKQEIWGSRSMISGEVNSGFHVLLELHVRWRCGGVGEIQVGRLDYTLAREGGILKICRDIPYRAAPSGIHGRGKSSNSTRYRPLTIFGWW
jgi:hypothetical protein